MKEGGSDERTDSKSVAKHVRGKRRSVILFCMPEDGHFQRTRPLISGLADHEIDVHVLTHRKYASQVKEEGGLFFDLFSMHPLELADDESFPIPSRFVTYAATYAEQIRRDADAMGASLVIHDSFAVIGQVTAMLLGVPRINICAGHNVVRERFLSKLQNDPRVKTSERCFQAVEVLRSRYGILDASPFSYIASPSPYLNIYCEPPEFLEENERHALEPVAFYGSIPCSEMDQRKPVTTDSCFGKESGNRFKVYVSFGTVIWRYYAEIAIRALKVLSAAFAEMDNVLAIISLGGIDIGREARSGLIKRNVSVEDYVDQRLILQESDAFFTHHGMNSTHEAISYCTPMVSYPFFWDQPELAQKCQALGLAIPLTHTLHGSFGESDVRSAIARLIAEKETMRAALRLAREWETAVCANRPEILRTIIGLMK